MNIEEIIRSVDLVIESASQNAVRFIVPQALKAGCDVMVLSVGALADEKGARDYLPGAAGDKPDRAREIGGDGLFRRQQAVLIEKLDVFTQRILLQIHRYLLQAGAAVIRLALRYTVQRRLPQARMDFSTSTSMASV